MKTLIVTDEINREQLLKQILRERGHEVTACQNRAEAWTNYQQNIYPLAIIHITLSEVDSLQLCRQMRSLPRGESSVILIMTNNKQQSNLQAILDAGADDYIIQPIEAQYLNLRLTVVEKLLRDRAPIQQLVSNLLPIPQNDQEQLSLKSIGNQQEYLILDRQFNILEMSSSVQRFADSPQPIIKYQDVRDYFPEIIGIEDQLIAIIEEEKKSFELPGIARLDEEGNPLYFDLYISKYRKLESFEDCLILLLNNTTEKMLLKQILVQRSNEAQLLVRKISANQDYIDKIISSIADALLVTKKSGEIKEINQATVNLFGYSEAECIGQSISLIISESEAEFLRKASLQHSFSQEEILCKRKTGEEITVAFSCADIQTDDNSVNFVYIGRDITERKRSIAEIKKLNASLQQRTLELETVNQELEAFSQTVSHDLRTPLSHISSFNQLLQEEYGEQLNEIGQDYIQQITNACDRMAQLIKDLLQMSHSTRREMNITTVDLTNLVKTIIDDLQIHSSERQVEWMIAPNISANGDHKLLRIALENLLGNAWKYTSKRELSSIEFGVISGTKVLSTKGKIQARENEEKQSFTSIKNESINSTQTIYFLRDNGAGFNMNYADKLFSPFGRLHSQRDFEGTGIGLATVQRIIQRHGGRIWAESEVDQGATFYFTLSLNC